MDKIKQIKLKPLHVDDVLKELEKLMDIIDNSEDEKLKEQAIIFLKTFKNFAQSFREIEKLLELMNFSASSLSQSFGATGRNGDWDFTFEQKR